MFYQHQNFGRRQTEESQDKIEPKNEENPQRLRINEELHHLNIRSLELDIKLKKPDLKLKNQVSRKFLKICLL